MGIEDTAADVPMTPQEPGDPHNKRLKRHHKPDQRRKRKHQKRKLKREAKV